jgi:hypothetical protein
MKKGYWLPFSIKLSLHRHDLLQLVTVLLRSIAVRARFVYGTKIALLKSKIGNEGKRDAISINT